MDNHTITVLVVDDNPANLKVLFDTLKRAGYKALAAQDGTGAIKQVAKLKPDIILLDIDMPGIDGFETCRRLKSKPETAGIPIIFLTASTETGDKVRGFDVGGVDYITKPINPQEVLARLNTHLTLRNLRQQLEEKNRQLNAKVQDYIANLQTEIEKRRLYQRERSGLLQNVSQQSEALQQLTSQIMAEHRQQNQLLGHALQTEVAAQLNLLQETLTTAQYILAKDNPEPLLAGQQLDSGLALLSRVQQQLQQVVLQLVPAGPGPDMWQNPLVNLSKRELEVLRQVVRGKTGAEIANILNISPKTVGVYRWRVMQKLEVDNVPDLIKLALKYHLIDLN